MQGPSSLYSHREKTDIRVAIEESKSRRFAPFRSILHLFGSRNLGKAKTKKTKPSMRKIRAVRVLFTVEYFQMVFFLWRQVC